MTEDEEDVITTIYADDTQSRAAAKTKEELEQTNSVGLKKVCQELKALRLKVNEGKTTYMVLATQGIRRRENLNSQIEVCGKVVKNVSVGKALGLLVSDDLSWRHQTEKVVKSCTAKLHGLWKCTSVLRKDQRKIKAEGIILPRLFLLSGDNVNRSKGKYGEAPRDRISSSKVGPTAKEDRLVSERWPERVRLAFSMSAGSLPDSEISSKSIEKKETREIVPVLDRNKGWAEEEEDI